MKNRVFFIIVIVLTLNSCKTNYSLSEKKKTELNKKIDKMYENDQKARMHFFVIDSIYGLEKFSYMMNRENNKYILKEKYNEYQQKIDSTWASLKEIDNVNTIELIKIVKENGFPNNLRLGVYKSKAYWIFVHSPEIFFSEINSLIEFEYSENRIFECEKEYIFWHTKRNRNGSPPMCGKNKEAVWIN